MPEQNDKPPFDLVLELLRAMRADITNIKLKLEELYEGQISTREEIHSMRGAGLRNERTLAAVQLDLDRVKDRLDLRDA